MKIVKIKFETEILIPIDTDDKEEGLREAQDKDIKIFENEDERNSTANEIADILGLDEEDNFSIKITNDKYEVAEI